MIPDPSRVIQIIRHAEKPPTSPPPYGVDIDGNQQRLISELAWFPSHRSILCAQFTSTVKTPTPSTPFAGLTSSTAGATSFAVRPLLL